MESPLTPLPTAESDAFAGDGGPADRAARLLGDLNEPQREAVKHKDGPLLIFAGAGSGKTRVLTYRAAYLIEHYGVRPHQILAVTFTNKAAREMRDRLDRLLGARARSLLCGTFHAICARILRSDGGRLGLARDFVIFDEDDQRTLMKEVFRDLDITSDTLKPVEVLNEIGRAKNELQDPHAYEAAAFSYFQEQVARCYHRYQAKLRENHGADFDDLIRLAVQLFEQHPDILAAYHDRFRYFLVDEYQDINFAQYQLVQHLVKQSRNLCVVGDDDQSIYAWRGADMRIILRFANDFPDATIVKLEQNYRSTQNILDAAYAVIQHNATRHDKRLWTARDRGLRAQCFQAADEHEEALFVARTVEDIVQHQGGSLAQSAVLYRTHAQSRVLEQVLLTFGMPYRIVGGLRFYERKEVKDILSYLRVLANPFDTVSLERALKAPARGIGIVTLDRLKSFASAEGVDLITAMLRVGEIADIAGSHRRAVADFVALLQLFIERAETASITDLARDLIEQTGYRRMLEEEGSIQARTRMENLDELLSATREFERETLLPVQTAEPAFGETGAEDDPPLRRFLEQVSLMTEADRPADETETLTLMTLHAAKGLEFDTVFLVGMEEGVFPLGRAAMSPNPDDLEEERRLCYVGMTRARDRLFLTLATTRMLYGNTNRNMPSRFLRDLPEVLVEGLPGLRAPQRVNWDTITTEPDPEAQEIIARARRERRARALVAESDDVPVSDIDAPFRAGQAVRHPKFGEGVVVSCAGTGKDCIVTVAFRTKGVKRLALAFAPLETI